MFELCLIMINPLIRLNPEVEKKIKKYTLQITRREGLGCRWKHSSSCLQLFSRDILQVLADNRICDLPHLQ